MQVRLPMQRERYDLGLCMGTGKASQFCNTSNYPAETCTAPYRRQTTPATEYRHHPTSNDRGYRHDGDRIAVHRCSHPGGQTRSTVCNR